MRKFIFVYITFPNKKEAKKIAEFLLNEKLVVCCNIFPIESIYLWKGEIENSKEIILIAKTLDKNFKKIKEETEELHSYSVPFIAKISAQINKEYLNWLKKELKQ